MLCEGFVASPFISGRKSPRRAADKLKPLYNRHALYSIAIDRNDKSIDYLLGDTQYPC